MFRHLLLVTTALLAVTSIMSAEARDAIAANADRVTASHIASAIDHRRLDKNIQFLCTYGGYDVNRYSSSSDYFKGSSWKHVAVPIRGHGRTVDMIVVRNGARHFDNSRRFSAGIYSTRQAAHLVL